MKETVGLLRAYFILSGLVSGALNVVAAACRAGGAKMIAIVGIGFAIAYVYAGVRLRPLIARSPRASLAPDCRRALPGASSALVCSTGRRWQRCRKSSWAAHHVVPLANVRRLAAESGGAAAPVRP
jgi:hypothetical protein